MVFDSDPNLVDEYQQLISPDSNFFFASGDMLCAEDNGDVDLTSFLNKKRRRGSQCQSPDQNPNVDQQGSGDNPEKEDSNDFQKYLDNLLGTNTPFLKSSEQLCPKLFFGIGMSPVCEVPGKTVMIIQPNVLYSDLDNIYPRTSSAFSKIFSRISF